MTATARRRPSYAEPTLDLFPDLDDVPLPFDTAPETVPVDEVDRLRIALAEALTYVETGHPAPGNRVRAWRQLIPAAPGIDRTATAWDRAIEGSLRAQARWTPEEVAAVDAAIATVAARARAMHTDFNGLEDFTADDVWAELGPGFTVTKGLTGRLMAAKHAGLIVNTGRTIIANRGGEHDHGQRLTVWRAL